MNSMNDLEITCRLVVVAARNLFTHWMESYPEEKWWSRVDTEVRHWGIDRCYPEMLEEQVPCQAPDGGWRDGGPAWPRSAGLRFEVRTFPGWGVRLILTVQLLPSGEEILITGKTGAGTTVLARKVQASSKAMHDLVLAELGEIPGCLSLN